MKKILTMILVVLVLVVTFAGCGGGETPPPEAPAETHGNPIFEPMGRREAEPDIILVIEDYALSLREITGIIRVSRPLSREIAYTSFWEHDGRMIYHHHRLESWGMWSDPLYVAERGGFSIMSEHIITIDGVPEVFRIMGDDEIFFRIYLGDWLPAGTHTAYFSASRIDYLPGVGITNSTRISNEVALEFEFNPEALAIDCDYIEIGGRRISPFELRLREEGRPIPGTEPTPDSGAPAFLPDTAQVTYYEQGIYWADEPYSINDIAMTAQQFELEMGRLYHGARYRLVSYRSIRSEDSFFGIVNGATDVFMTRSEAITKLDNETEPWASAYLAVFNGIPTRPVAGHPEFGIGDFVEYGVDSVSFHDLTGNNIPELYLRMLPEAVP